MIIVFINASVVVKRISFPDINVFMTSLDDIITRVHDSMFIDMLPNVVRLFQLSFGDGHMQGRRRRQERWRRKG